MSESLEIQLSISTVVTDAQDRIRPEQSQVRYRARKQLEAFGLQRTMEAPPTKTTIEIRKLYGLQKLLAASINKLPSFKPFS